MPKASRAALFIGARTNRAAERSRWFAGFNRAGCDDQEP